MMREIARHLDPDELERYSMGNTAAAETESLEQHLLLCGSCREALVEAQQYLAAMCCAAREYRNPPSPAPSVANPVVGCGAAR